VVKVAAGGGGGEIDQGILDEAGLDDERALAGGSDESGLAWAPGAGGT
jgi:hypothetical protein